MSDDKMPEGWRMVQSVAYGPGILVDGPDADGDIRVVDSYDNDSYVPATVLRALLLPEPPAQGEPSEAEREQARRELKGEGWEPDYIGNFGAFLLERVKLNRAEARAQDWERIAGDNDRSYCVVRDALNSEREAWALAAETARGWKREAKNADDLAATYWSEVERQASELESAEAALRIERERAQAELADYDEAASVIEDALRAELTVERERGERLRAALLQARRVIRTAVLFPGDCYDQGVVDIDEALNPTKEPT